MAATTSQVSVRYATALFELAREKGVSAEVDRDVEAIGRELADPRVAAYFADARISRADKRARLESLAGSVHPLVANFLRLVADKQRLAVLAELASAYRRNLLRERGAVEGVVESARPIGAQDLAQLADTLARRLSKQVELENRIEPSLLAGARVIVDNRMIDASASGRLESLRAKLLAARLSAQSV